MNRLARLLDFLFPPRGSERLAREADGETLARFLTPRVVPFAGESATALFPYKNLPKALIVEAKFHADLRSARLLGEALAEYLLEVLADACSFQGRAAFLVPVPLHEARRRERGHNQAERICREALARLEGLATVETDALARVRATLPQTSLGRDARQANMQGAFAALRPLDPDALYIVVDDVVTTGATMSAAAAALRAGGASSVMAVALAA